MNRPMLDGEAITLANARTLVLKRYPRARCEGVTGRDGQRDYFVYRGVGPRAGEMYLAYASTKPGAWKAAALALLDPSPRELQMLAQVDRGGK